jgi:hypothetical protein
VTISAPVKSLVTVWILSAWQCERAYRMHVRRDLILYVLISQENSCGVILIERNRPCYWRVSFSGQFLNGFSSLKEKFIPSLVGA